MSTNGETADMVVRESIQITESAVKLAGLGAKNLAALLVAVAKDNPKLSGKTGLKRLIQDGEELAIFSVKQEDLRGFQMESKRYGVLFYPIINRVEKTGTVEIMAKAKDARQINRIFERMGYPAPVREDDTAKKANPRARSESSFRERGNGARTSTEMDKQKEFLGDEYLDYNLVVALPNGRPCEETVISNAFRRLKRDAKLPNVVFHSLRHSSTTYKLKLNHGDIKATQGDTGHSQADMVTKVYAHILDEDRKVNAQKFESAFYANPDLRSVKAPDEPQTALDVQSIIVQLQQSPELLSALTSLISNQGCK